MSKNRRARRPGFGLRTWLTLIVIVSVGLPAIGSSLYDYHSNRSRVIDFTRGALEMLVATGSLQITGEDVLAIDEESDFDTEEYARLYDTIGAIYLQNASKLDRPNRIYILRPTADPPNVFFAFHLPERGADFELGEIEAMADPVTNYMGDRHRFRHPEMLERLMDGKATFESTDVYTTENGTWVSAFAPIKTRDGQVVAILEADYEIAQIQEQVWMVFLTKVIAIVIAAALTVVLILLFARWFTGPVQRISQAVDRIAAGDFGVRLNLRRRDELGTLAEHFNSMADVLEKNRKLARYVSADTISRLDVKGDRSTERAVATVLFSDIRGFTAYADAQPVEKVVEVLNEMLQIQADIIHRNRGNIDKFVGDEVMAVFKGESMHRNAALAARAIQESLADIKEREGLGVGIGIHTGVVVVGDIGSDDRMDHTVIGSTVNLASRLCSRAASGQTLVTKDFCDPLIVEDDDFADRRYIGRGRAKGFSGTVRVYDLTPDMSLPEQTPVS